jgi:hypothetical protein
MIFCCMDTTHFVYLLTSCGHSGCLYLWAIVNSATMNIRYKILFEHLHSILLGLGVELFGYMVTLCITF